MCIYIKFIYSSTEYSLSTSVSSSIATDQLLYSIFIYNVKLTIMICMACLLISAKLNLCKS